jgi:hypothetical protein
MLLEVLAGAGGGLATGIVLGWWYFRRRGVPGPAGDGDEASDAAGVASAEVAGVEARLADLERVHAGCAARLAERERLIAVLREQAAGAAARLSDLCHGAAGP